MVSWQGQEAGGGQLALPRPLNFSLSEFLFVAKVCVRNTKVWTENSPFLRNFGVGIGILSTRVSSVGNSQLSAPYVLNPRPR